ncbi:MAG: hypothetical protein NC080_07570 [Paraprevotella sp.]|nr:hypothetical protein [Paraprevotella sp.]
MSNQQPAANVVPYLFNSNSIRTISEAGEARFCASDVCRALGYSNVRTTIVDNCKPKGVAKRYTLTKGGEQAVVFINEPNLYRLIIRSKKREAQAFEEWVMEEVLPQIRKTGTYINKAYKTANTDSLSAEQADALRNALRKAAEKLPKDKQQRFMVLGWSKLKAHFGCSYREIPAHEYSESLSIVARHIAEHTPEALLLGKPEMRPVVWMRPEEFGVGGVDGASMEQHYRAMSAIINSLVCWGRDNLPEGEVADSFEQALQGIRRAQDSMMACLNDAIDKMTSIMASLR